MTKIRFFANAFICFSVAGAASTAIAGGIIHDVSKSSTVLAIPINEMSELRGAALIISQPYPSVVSGLKTHMVSYKGWGSIYDYVSYNYIGSSYSGGSITRQYNGNTYLVGGDEWKADLYSGPNTWTNANSQLIEYHYQILNPGSGAPSAYALRDLAWNRPISKFFW